MPHLAFSLVSFDGDALPFTCTNLIFIDILLLPNSDIRIKRPVASVFPGGDHAIERTVLGSY